MLGTIAQLEQEISRQNAEDLERHAALRAIEERSAKTLARSN